MGITQVGSGKLKAVEEGNDLELGHDAAEDPFSVLEPEGSVRDVGLSHGGCGSSSLRECIELLNSISHKSPATCHSGAKTENEAAPPQVMSPNVEESQTAADQNPSDLTSGALPMPKEEPWVPSQQAKSEVSTPKLEPLMTDVKEEAEDFDTPGRSPAALPEETLGAAETHLMILKTL